MTRAAIPLLVALLQGGAVLVGTSPGSGRAGMVVELSPFEDNLYAQLLMRAVTGSIYPTDTFPDHYVSPDFPKQPYDFDKRKYGLDFPAVGHTMVGWVRLQNLYMAIRTCIAEGVAGDYVEAGVWRGGASIFAAGVLREAGCLGRPSPSKDGEGHAGCGMDVYLCDSFKGFEPDPWDGDKTWVKLNDIVAVSQDQVRANFEQYQLGAFLDTSVHFVQGYFADSLPQLGRVDAIAILRLDGDLFSSTMDILFNLYSKVAIGGFVIIDDYGIEQCAHAVDTFREYHGIEDAMEEIDAYSGARFWRKTAHVEILWDMYERYTFVRSQRQTSSLDDDEL